MKVLDNKTEASAPGGLEISLNTDFRVEIIPNIITNARWLEYE